ncbi:hypothetical protein GSI_09140 [Ganoderma sinense ZZ0214-1]|uniref:Uncharacterized protein n=1 Tax=Ganoderma sinense ZZ0214-1 TaxID=1077348 RepID=A0A2G8S5N8_9APHY|nr:hypothetical protein GSI_09140 [Ganoderma sinense ZZ0214-1]
MPKANPEAKKKTQKKAEAANKQRPASPARRQGARGNLVPVITGLPPTPPRKKVKGKRGRDEDENDEDPEEPKKKKMKGAKNAAAGKAARPADPDRPAPGPSASGKHGRQVADRSSQPRSLSPSTAGGSTSSSQAPSSSSKTSAPPSHNTSSSRRRSSPLVLSEDSSSSRGSSSHAPSAKAAAPSQPVPPDAFENAAAAFKRVQASDVDSDDFDLGEDGCGKLPKNILKLVLEEPLEDNEEGEEAQGGGDEDKDDEDEGEGEGGDDNEGDDNSGAADDNAVETDDKDDGNGEELSTRQVKDFIAFVRELSRRKFCMTKEESDPHTIPGHFKKWARHISRLCGVFTSVHNVFTCGMAIVTTNPHTAEDYEVAYKQMRTMSAKAAKFYTKKFFYLCDEIPKFKLLCQHMLSHPGDISLIAKFLEIHASAGRSSDIATIKRNFHSYLPTVSLPNDIYIAPLSYNQYKNLKTRNGGYNLECSARLVVPINERDAFDREPLAYTKRKSTQCKQRQDGAARQKRHKDDRPQSSEIDDEKTLPSFLFPTYLMYDDLNPQRGLLKGDLCVTVFRHLFTGPSSAGLGDGESGDGCLCLIGIYKIKCCTPELITYVATLVRHLLSIDGRWQGDTNNRSGHRFHTALHTILSVDFDAWKERKDSVDVDMDSDVDDDVDVVDENIFSYFNRSQWGDPETQVIRDPCDFDFDDDDSNIRQRILNARKAELARQQDDRAKGKQRAKARQRAPSELPPSSSRSSSVELFEGPPPSDQAENGVHDVNGDRHGDADIAEGA